MKKTLIVASCLALLVAGYIGLRLATAPTPGVTVENFFRLYKGMPAEEVEALLGPKRPRWSDQDDQDVWDSDGVRIIIDHRDGRVVFGWTWLNDTEGVVIGANATLLNKIGNWLGL